jgi:hypothetical protein
MAIFINGWSIEESTKTFENLAKLAFRRRKVLDIPFLSRVHELLKSYLADGMYPAENIQAALKEVFGTDRSILDSSHATSIGTRVGLLVSTIREPARRILTNYDRAGSREQDQGKSFGMCRSPRNIHSRDVFINRALDKTLASAIFETISQLSLTTQCYWRD